MILLGPKEPKFLAIFQKSSEAHDGEPDPLDHWSVHVLESLAAQLHAIALLPFGGPLSLPFYCWPLRRGHTHVSAIKFLVHDQSGLFLSFRGSLAFNEHISLPTHLGQSPYVGCPAPCRTACPIKAFDGESYHFTACKSHVTSVDHNHCGTQDCSERHSCPISENFARPPGQSEFHMKAFL